MCEGDDEDPGRTRAVDQLVGESPEDQAPLPTADLLADLRILAHAPERALHGQRKPIFGIGGDLSDRLLR